MRLLKNTNLGVAFLLELLAILILAYWGFTFSASKILSISLGVLVPILLIIIWSIWCAPSSAYRLEGIGLILLKCLLFGSIVLCLININHLLLALIFALTVILNLGVSLYFKTL